MPDVRLIKRLREEADLGRCTAEGCPQCTSPELLEAAADELERYEDDPLGDVVLEALRHFRHLDEANAAIHCAEVRYSPITFRLANALVGVDPSSADDECVAAVLAHDGRYQLDKGR